MSLSSLQMNYLHCKKTGVAKSRLTAVEHQDGSTVEPLRYGTCHAMVDCTPIHCKSTCVGQGNCLGPDTCCGPDPS